MKQVQLILDSSSVKFEKATSIYRIRNILIVEYMNDNGVEEAYSIDFEKVTKIFVGSRRVLKDKIVDRENPEIFPED